MKKDESQKFWINLLQNVVCMPAATGYIVFEERIKFDHTSFIDVYINTTYVVIKQKNLGKDFRKAIR